MTQIISRLKLWQKFTLIGLVALALALVASALLVQQRYQELVGTKTELAGLTPAQDLIQLVQLTQQHRGLSAGLLAGNESFAADLRARNEAIAKAVDQTSASVATLMERTGDRTLSELSAQVQQDWNALSTAVQSRGIGGPQSFHAHTALIETQLALLYRVLDASGLTLDPVPATYYLTIALLDHQPTQTELLGQIRAVGAAVLTRQVITPEERLSLQTAESMAKLHNQKTRALVAKAVESEPGLKASIGVAMQQAGAEHDAAVRLLRDQVLRPGELNHAPKAYFASLTQAIDAEYRLMNAGLTELRALLEQRIARAERLLLLLLGGVTGAIVFTLWISLATVRQANRAVKATLAAAHALANGDLKHPIQVDSRDEFGAIADALGESMASLATMVRDIKQVINTVNTASAEIALGTEDLSTRTEEQASSLEQTSASMDELSRAVRLNSEHARQANEMALQACEVARNGGDTVHEVVESMQSINHSSRRIADIIGVIDSIAFQTNILALNASVEAARAGEQGRGFAVVASEVRNLAQRSAQAAQEIKSLITDSVKQIETGARQADQAGQTVHGIVDAISRVTTLMAEISQASASQAQGITQVVEAVTHMDGMTQQNASLVEETAHASRSLEIQANQVAQAMERFQL